MSRRNHTKFTRTKRETSELQVSKGKDYLVQHTVNDYVHLSSCSQRAAFSQCSHHQHTTQKHLYSKLCTSLHSKDRFHERGKMLWNGTDMAFVLFTAYQTNLISALDPRHLKLDLGSFGPCQQLSYRGQKVHAIPIRLDQSIANGEEKETR